MIRIKRLLFILVGVVLTYGAFAFIWIFLLGQEQPAGTRAPFSETPTLGIAQLLAAVIPVAFIMSKLVLAKSKKLLLQVLMILAIVELISLNSRGPLIAFLAGAICLFLLYSPGEKKRFALVSIPAIIVIVCAFLLLPPEYTGRYALLTDIQSSSVAARLDMWQFVAGHFSDWFFTGAGIFGFGYYYNLIGTDFSLWGTYSHNIFLDVFASTGFFGLIAFLWLIGSLIYDGIKIIRIREQPFHSLGLATVVPLIIFLVAGLFSMSIIGTRPLWFFGGVILSLCRLSQKDKRKTNLSY
ncbi:MAG: O-antigen ligase family protein [Dehalococcoidia bacterium]|nr:O-antigen ligase family protein [Dehalococcoidia bacterium]